MSALSATPIRRRRGWLLLSVLLTPALAVGLAVLSAGPAEAANHQVRIQQYAYGPSGLSIAQGDTVTWTNLDTVAHDVFVTNGPESFRSPMLGKGQSWSHTFTVAGSYSYICSVHPDMRGSVSVKAAPVPAGSASAHPSHSPEAGQSTAASPLATGSNGSSPAAAPTPAPTTTPTTAPAAVPAAVPASATTTLNPLLLVAGASIAVVVFCLLLMASRPVYPVAAEPAPTSTPDPPASDDTLVQAAVGAEPAGDRGDPS